MPLVPKSAKRVLELGCGDGAFARAFRQGRQVEYWGIELESEAANRASAHLDKVFSKRVEDALAELPNAYFELLICNDVLEHLPNPEETLRALREKLAPKGQLFLSVPNVRFLPVLLQLLLKKDWRYEDAGVLDRTHLRFFTEKSLRRFVAESGFELISLQGINSRSNWLFQVANFCSLGSLTDTQYPQFAALATLP
jgi:2-polyprenyl-3-methyl-5-hydroxy-6-metoxy-1,4-benzoquinol methylase